MIQWFQKFFLPSCSACGQKFRGLNDGIKLKNAKWYKFWSSIWLCAPCRLTMNSGIFLRGKNFVKLSRNSQGPSYMGEGGPREGNLSSPDPNPVKQAPQA